jgi:katanin p60 ATPase-containing subunit A1
LETAECFEAEAQLSSQYSICDNIDLSMILQEYETYYYLKFQKPLKICKLSPKSDTVKETSKSAGKPKIPIQRNKRPSLEESKQDDIADLMNIQSLQNKEETSEAVPPFKEAASIPFSKEMLEMSENISREIVSSNFDIKWDDVIGLKKAKQTLQETLSLPMQYPGLFQGILAPWKSVLLYGPPGTGDILLFVCHNLFSFKYKIFSTGKTMMAKALASESKMTFFNITATSVVSKWRGESEKLMRVI